MKPTKPQPKPKKVGGVLTYAGLAEIIRRSAPSPTAAKMREALLWREAIEGDKDNAK